MRRTTIFLEESLERDLKALARRQRRSVASVVREAVAQYVASTRAARPSLRFVAAGRSGARDTAERHEALLFSSLQPHGVSRSKRGRPEPRRPGKA